jgi:hypothetical protein
VIDAATVVLRTESADALARAEAGRGGDATVPACRAAAAASIVAALVAANQADADFDDSFGERSRVRLRLLVCCVVFRCMA